MIPIRTSNVLPAANPPPSPTDQCSHCYHQDTTGICQSFDISKFTQEDLPTSLDQPICALLPPDPIISRNNFVMHNTDIMAGVLAPVEQLPTEIFGTGPLLSLFPMLVHSHANFYT